MPGVVGDVRCAVGDRVEAGQVLVVLEAMKMEHHIRAPFAGTVADVPVTVGQQVDNGALLVTIDEGNL
jgi:biotin carboxyl carrier protein